MGRSRGRPKKIETPERMWVLFTMYKEWVNNNPILIEDYVGKDADRVMRQKPRPLTMTGFECFVMDNTDITYPDLSHYFSPNNDSFKDFVAINTRIRLEIQTNQISGGMAGIFNHTLTARINGLVEKTETKTEIRGAEEIVIKRKRDD